MTSYQGRPLSGDDEKRIVDLDPILECLGRRGRYQLIQLMLTIFASFAYAITLMDAVFTGYQPDYRCSEVENVTELEAYLPDDVTNFTLHDVTYEKCSIDVTVNSSGTSSTHSLPCVAGVNFSMPSDTSFLTEWSLVCDKAGLSQLTQTCLFAGQLAGNLVFCILADRCGRKRVYIVCALGAALSFIGMGTVPSYYPFLVCKITVGFFVTGMVHAGYTMFMELIPKPWRSIASFLDSMLWTLGCLFLAALAYCLQGFSWRYLTLAVASVFGYSLLLPWFLDESLRWLVATGEIDHAEKILKKACHMNGKDFEEIRALLHKQISTTNNKNSNNSNNSDNNSNSKDHSPTDATNESDQRNKTDVTKEEKMIEGITGEKVYPGSTKEEKAVDSVCKEGISLTEGRDDRCTEIGEGPLQSEDEVFSAKYTVLDLCRHRVVFVPFLVTTFVWMTCSLYFYAVILGSANLSGNRFLNFSLLNLQDIPSNLVAFFLLHKFNRRPLWFVYHFLAGLFLLLSVSLIALGGDGITLKLATAAQYLGMFSLTGSFILLFVCYMEFYPTAMRAVGTGASGMLIKVADLSAPFFLLWAERTPWAPGVLLGCLCCLASGCIWILPETRHRKLPDTVEEIQAWKRKEPDVS